MKLYIRFVCVALLCLGFDQGFSNEVEKGGQSELNEDAPDSLSVLNESSLAFNDTDLSEGDGMQYQSQHQRSFRFEAGILGGGGLWNLKGSVFELRAGVENSIIYFPVDMLVAFGKFVRLRGWLGFVLGDSENVDELKPYVSLYMGGKIDLRSETSGVGKRASNMEIGVGGGAVSPDFILASWITVPIHKEKDFAFRELFWLNTRIQIAPMDLFYFAFGLRIGVGILRLDVVDALGEGQTVVKDFAKQIVDNSDSGSDITVPVPLGGVELEIGFKVCPPLTIVTIVEVYTSNMDSVASKGVRTMGSLLAQDFIGLLARAGVIFNF